VKDDGLYLLHMRECIHRVRQYTADGKQEFWADSKTQDAVLRNLQTLAESAQRLSAELKARRPDVDWRAISGFRNILVHDYLGVDLDDIWNIVTQDIPTLDLAIATLSAELGLPPGPTVPHT
jgi:uncharacterized protein with HEPN domain